MAIFYKPKTAQNFPAQRQREAKKLLHRNTSTGMVQLVPFSNSKRKGKAGGASGGSRCVDSTVLFRGKAYPLFSVILSRQTPSFSGFADFWPLASVFYF
jgi:hypothetical protein